MKVVSRLGLEASAIPAIAAAMIAAVCPPAAADAVSDFYKGKTMTMFVGSAPGGGYDSYARLVSRHFNHHVPGRPGIVVKNMPGASGLRLAGYMYAKAKRDGIEAAGVHNTIVVEEIFDRGQRYKSTEFNWLGSVNQLTSVCIASDKAPVQSWPETKERQLLVGGTGAASSSTNLVPAFLKSLTGAKLRIIKGYPSTTSVILAMQRGEVEGLCGLGWDSLKAQAYHLLKDKKIKVIIQVAKQPHPELKDAPFVMDMATSPDDIRVLEFLVARQYMGRPYLAPPGVPEDRVTALRNAFVATMNDPKFKADAEKTRIPTSPITGEEVQAHIKKLFATPASVIARANEATKLRAGDVASAKLNWITVKDARIERVEKRSVYFKDGGKTVEANARRAEIEIGGKRAKRNALKAGMVCDITYLGNGDAAKAIACAD